MANALINTLMSAFAAVAPHTGEAAHPLPVAHAFTTKGVFLHSPYTLLSGEPRLADWLERSQAQIDAMTSCGNGDCEPLKTMDTVWAGRIEAMRNLPREVQMQLVNTKVNLDVNYASDHKNFGVDDYWQTPIDTLTSSKGDCEDYALAKMELLKGLGFNERDLRVIFVQDTTQNNKDHAVLAVHHKGETYILDNDWGEIKPASDFPQYSIVGGADERGIWTYPGTDTNGLAVLLPDKLVP